MNKINKIIGIHGKARSGKDTIATYLISGYYNYMKYSFADPLKEACAIKFGIPLEDFYDDNKKDVINEFWGFSPRQMAQLEGTEGGRDLFGDDIWIKRAEMFLNTVTVGTKIIIPDIRFENEAEFIRNRGGIIVHIERPNAKAVSAHSSENGIKFVAGDIKIINDGTLVDLYNAIERTIL